MKFGFYFIFISDIDAGDFGAIGPRQAGGITDAELDPPPDRDLYPDAAGRQNAFAKPDTT